MGSFSSALPIVGSVLGGLAGSKKQSAGGTQTMVSQPWGPAQDHLKQIMDMAMSLQQQNLYPQQNEMVAGLSPLQKFAATESIGTVYDPALARVMRNTLLNTIDRASQGTPASQFFATILGGGNPVGQDFTGRGLMANRQDQQGQGLNAWARNLLEENPLGKPTVEEESKLSDLKKQVNEYMQATEDWLNQKSQTQQTQQTQPTTSQAATTEQLSQMIQDVVLQQLMQKQQQGFFQQPRDLYAGELGG